MCSNVLLGFLKAGGRHIDISRLQVEKNLGAFDEAFEGLPCRHSILGLICKVINEKGLAQRPKNLGAFDEAFEGLLTLNMA